MRKIATIVLCVFGAVAMVTGKRLPAADEAEEKVDTLVRSELARQRIPGVKLRVYREGKLTRSKSWAGAEELGEVSTPGIDGANGGRRAEESPVPRGLFAKDAYAFDWADEE